MPVVLTMKGLPTSLDADMVCDLLREQKRETGLTDQQLADSYGVCQSYMSKLLAGDVKPGAKILRALGLRKVVYYEWTE